MAEVLDYRAAEEASSGLHSNGRQAHRRPLRSETTRKSTKSLSLPWRRSNHQVSIVLAKPISPNPSDGIIRELTDIMGGFGECGLWLRYIPPRLESSTILTGAMRAFVYSLRNLVQPSFASLTTDGTHQYVDTLQNLRRTSLKGEQEALAMHSLAAFEALRGTDFQAFSWHVFAETALILGDKSWSTNEVARSLMVVSVSALCYICTVKGQPCPYEQSPWIDWEPPPLLCDDTAKLYKCGFRVLAKLPRLVACVREFRAKVASTVAKVADLLVGFAELLLEKDQAAECSFRKRCTITDTVSDQDRPIVPLSLAFNNFEDFDAFLTYAMARLHVLNLFDSALPLLNGLEHSVASDIQTERIRMTDAILMCWEYCIANGALSWKMSVSLVPAWSCVSSMSFYHGFDRATVRAWLEVKCIMAWMRWKSFRGRKDMDALSDLFLGSSNQESFMSKAFGCEAPL